MVRLKKRKKNSNIGFRECEKSDFNIKRSSETFNTKRLDNFMKSDEYPRDGMKTRTTSILSSSIDKSETKKALSKPWLSYPDTL